MSAIAEFQGLHGWLFMGMNDESWAALEAIRPSFNGFSVSIHYRELPDDEDGPEYPDYHLFRNFDDMVTFTLTLTEFGEIRQLKP